MAVRAFFSSKFWTNYGGPILTFAVMGLMDLLRDTPLSVANPGVPFIVVIVYAGFVGGLRPAAVSGLLGFSYVLYYFSPPGHPFEYVADDRNRLWVLVFAFPAIIWLVSALKRGEERQRGQLRQLASVVEFSDDAIVGERPDGTITTWNPAAERLYVTRQLR